MLGLNIFFKIFKYNQNNTNEIVQYDSIENFSLKNRIKTNINEIDQKISENSNALMEAQIVKFRSTFSKSNNLIEKIGRNAYKTKLEDSINWHQIQIKELYDKRRKLEITLEKLQGIFWFNQVKRILKVLLIGFFVFLSLFIFLSGFMIIIYLMPLIILILLGYLITTKRN
tara:strand:- start:511 stop:1023 length:513 start_codon:yes stop_codon:yes gene_type:complete